MDPAAFLTRNAVDALPAGELEKKLALDRPLRVKLGVDPTSADIHLGHAVVLTKLREFQDLGHKVVLIVGDYTARVGDPSGRSKTRPVVSGEQIDENARTYTEQAMTILRDDPALLEVRRNSEWLDMPMEDLFRLARVATAAQILERDDFAKRFAAREPISILELLYPLLQGYDSVAIRADVELGGTDQKFNLLLGRDVQRAYGVKEQCVLTMPLLVGTDGVEKMSKSLGNYVGVTDGPPDMYGKTLSIPDDVIDTWTRLLGMELGDVASDAGPRERKRALARAVVRRFHGDGAAVAAEERFDTVFVRKDIPDDVEEHVLALDTPDPVHLPALIADVFGGSRSDARRLVQGGGVKLDGEALPPGEMDVPLSRLDGVVLQAGKRRFRRLRSA
ncbi:MAG TPA: tyrosine--tRNA ligase [Solirubrobacteraceae bacterium]|nr:tyrosine--tRNA ligase [Solirubrobacteraceae bacterium]